MTSGQRKAEVRQVTNGYIVVCFEFHGELEEFVWVEQQCLVFRDVELATESVIEWVRNGVPEEIKA